MSLTRRNLLLLAATIGIAAGPATAYAADVLNVGAYPTNPPFEYKNESGTFEGFEVVRGFARLRPSIKPTRGSPGLNK